MAHTQAHSPVEGKIPVGVPKISYQYALLSKTDSFKLENGKGAGMEPPFNFATLAMSVSAKPLP
jgi:hypothetical protein